ncbi:MAG TPA: hypothetical protein VEX60_13480, partial [Pyrinomonadaceae bacterium]|nr:hypothetical protein [Pyrinomonadaceae bacterium]
DYSSRQSVLQRPSRFVTEVPPELYEIWSLEEESTSATPALEARTNEGGEDEGDAGGGDGYVN